MSAAERRRRRLRVDELPNRDELVELRGGPLRHLHVLRAGVGDAVFVFDGHGREAEGVVRSIDSDAARVEMVSDVVDVGVESALACWLVQAVPARPAKMDAIVRQVTELGVHRIVPVVVERSGGRPTEAALASRVERWRRIVVAAAEQSGRRWLPEIEPPRRFDELAWAKLPEERLVADPSASTGAWELSLPAPAVAVLVGPEGGWTTEEMEVALANGGRVVGLGPRVLRTETASVVAVAMCQHRWGDLG